MSIQVIVTWAHGMFFPHGGDIAAFSQYPIITPFPSAIRAVFGSWLVISAAPLITHCDAAATDRLKQKSRIGMVNRIVIIDRFFPDIIIRFSPLCQTLPRGRFGLIRFIFQQQ